MNMDNPESGVKNLPEKKYDLKKYCASCHHWQGELNRKKMPGVSIGSKKCADPTPNIYTTWMRPSGWCSRHKDRKDT